MRNWDILVELGRKRIAGRQEDMIEDTALFDGSRRNEGRQVAA
ncbi:hypothetical protein [Burkholderia vietnamiensis]|nr:hypothetical protein [Burkholderia vietnamiensis]MDN8071215.1 hypothetical protein [Burkholderia vietnamiensis]